MTHNRIRPLMVMDSLSVGGTETYVLSLVKTFPSIGVVPVYAGASGVMYDAFVRAGCPIHLVGLTAEQLMDPERQKQADYALTQIMRSRKIDLLHIHQTPSGLYAADAARKLGIPVVFTVHGAYYPPDQLQLMKEAGCTFVSVSPPVQGYLDYQGIPSYLIANGVDFEQYRSEPSAALRAQLNIHEGEKIVVYASRLAWDKAVVCAMLVRAARTIRLSGSTPLHVVIAGSGNQSAVIAELAEAVNQECGTTFVHLVGSQLQMRDYYNLGDLVVGTGRVALEAMACGKPVLAIGNHGYFGLVDQPVYDEAWQYYFGDHNSKERPSEQLIGAAITEALASADRLEAVGRQGQAWARANFHIRDKALQMKQLYGDLLTRT
ncbi:glycosyltransferase involved in cell wall biosynthesis [Paenibacillus cellulosilyticus]|uniref:Glycosyltransferase involved in cell wall biosynthesis n=2 Tax=Paenibacillus cellulosilyticus TaxID=375489 RepID=A0A2V2YTR2_9BACL|nr:glycosyltransferase involved in cell wall biosynthesis [Paenibacillus cellulosilyticus]QKS46581.1 glycosyltransferase [Paenibacillus cellulosilyticus]